MESVNENNLGELFAKNKLPAALSDITSWADQLLDTLNQLHKQIPPVIHRDITPENINSGADGRIVLSAPASAENAEAKARHSPSAANQTAAALLYLPLEQIWSGLDAASQKVVLNGYDESSELFLMQPPDARSDIYSIGATLYHLATARAPIDALERSIDILEGKPDPLPTPNRLNPAIPPEVSDVLMRAMEIRRENRFHSAVIMRQVLRTALVRVREREVEEAKKPPEATHEISKPAEQKRIEPERTPVAQEQSLRVGVGQNGQPKSAELKSPEGETQKLKATPLVVKPQQTPPLKTETANQGSPLFLDLDDDEFLELDDIQPSPANSKPLKTDAKPLTANIKPPKDFAAAPPPVFHKTSAAPFAAPKNSSEEFEFSLAAPPKGSKHLWRISVAAVILVLFGGAFAAFNFFQSPTAAEMNQTLSEQPTSLPKTPALPAVVETAPVVEKSSEMTVAPESAASPDLTETPVNQPPVKNKFAAPRVVKQQIAPPKTAVVQKPANRKKAVTVDDIISGN